MADEIERKFKLISNQWEKLSTKAIKIRQGYLQSGLRDEQKSSVRIRLEQIDNYQVKATINVKSAEMSVHRSEYEYIIPVSDAETMLNTLCEAPILEKTRYLVPYGQHTWEIDIFEGDNIGLEIAEVELKNMSDDVKIPDWIGEEVSDDPRYYNIYLLKKPFNLW